MVVENTVLMGGGADVRYQQEEEERSLSCSGLIPIREQGPKKRLFGFSDSLLGGDGQSFPHGVISYVTAVMV